MRAPKYSLREIERKLLVDPALLPDLSTLPFTQIDDRYLHGGRLRLRAMTDSASGVTSYKLGKKYGANAGLYLCEAEAPTLEVLLALTFPPFAVRDVTAEPGFSRWALAAAQSRA